MRGPESSLGLIAIVLLSLTCTGSVGAISFRNPFDPAQCDRAIAYAVRRIGSDEDGRAKKVFADALLCRGLSGDDWALRDSIALLAPMVATSPTDVHVWVSLAEALRRQAPASEEAILATERARQVLEGEVRAEGTHRPIIDHLAANEVAMRKQRMALLEYLRATAAASVAGVLSPVDLYRVVSTARLLGDAGDSAARRILGRHRDAAAPGSAVSAMIELLETESELGKAPVEIVLPRYEGAAAELCGGWQTELDAAICETTWKRLSSLRRIAVEREAGVPTWTAWRKE